MKIALVLGVCVVCIAGSLSAAAEDKNDAQAPALPPQIVALQKIIQDMKPGEAMTAITAQLGAPTREIGSGIRIPQWDVAGGTLTAHPSVGPTFRIKGQTHWLLRTKNKAEQNLVGSYEMSTPADPANHGNRYWIGNLNLTPYGAYRFAPSGTNPKEAAPLAHSFFFEHPAGTYTVTYAGKVTADSLLEDQTNGAVIATLRFTSATDETKTASYQIRVDTESRFLNFASAAERGPDFEMYKGWKRYWGERSE